MEDLGAIGERAAQAIRDRAKKKRIKFEDECKNLNFFKNCVEAWEEKGYAPSAHYLQKMCFAGYDVIYILTGEKNG